MSKTLFSVKQALHVLYACSSPLDLYCRALRPWHLRNVSSLCPHAHLHSTEGTESSVEATKHTPDRASTTPQPQTDPTFPGKHTHAGHAHTPSSQASLTQESFGAIALQESGSFFWPLRSACFFWFRVQVWQHALTTNHMRTSLITSSLRTNHRVWEPPRSTQSLHIYTRGPQIARLCLLSMFGWPACRFSRCIPRLEEGQNPISDVFLEIW